MIVPPPVTPGMIRLPVSRQVIWKGVLIFAVWWCCPILGLAADVPPDAEFFERNVEPILTRRCYECHSHVAGEMQGGLTLDSRSGWETGGDSGPAVVPGNPEVSLLIQAVERKDLKMPPDEALPPEDVAILKQWVERGAFDVRVVQPASKPVIDAGSWWAVQLLKPPPVPFATSRGMHPVDAFLQGPLAKAGLGAAPEADRRSLIRRLTFDLHGMPPSPDEVAAFVEDRSPDAYEKLVDRLLNSPRYGERYARLWLDVAHYGESNGFGMDRPRMNAWPYRDYVIERLNADVPYDRFVREQIAVDVLYPQEPQLIPALGFLAAGPFNQSALAEQVDGTLCKKIALNLDRDDMVTTVATSFLSLTLHCARCHDHKFDPLTQDDYYGMQAVFAGAIRGERPYGSAEQVRRAQHWMSVREQLNAGKSPELLDPETQARLREVAFRIVEQAVTAERPWKRWAATVSRQSTGPAAEALPDGSYRFSEAVETDIYTLAGPLEDSPIAAVRIEVLADDKLPNKGPGLQPQNGNFALTEVKLEVAPADRPTEARSYKFKSVRADFNQAGWSIDQALDGNPTTGWSVDPQEGRSHAAVLVLEEPVTAPAGSLMTLKLEQTYGRQHILGRVRVSVAADLQGTDAAYSPDLVNAVRDASGGQLPSTDFRGETLSALFRLAVDRVIAELPPLSMVYAVGGDAAGFRNYQRPAAPRPIHRLVRGDVARPGPEVLPGGMRAMPVAFQIPPETVSDDGTRRAALAQWLASPDNPLVWRSIANRMWAWHFGVGLVSTPNDFGQMGAAPTHPELLDYLACELRDHGGSLKQLHRVILTSHAYRQSSQGSPMAQAIDGDNRLVWRMSRRRLDAEQIRDALLVISGRLDPTMGGPSVMQFQFDDPNKEVSPQISYEKFDVDSPASLRRGIYRFLFRNVNDPLLEAFDAPDPSLSVPQRSTTITPQQALALYNNPFVLRQCEVIAQRLETEHPDREAQIDLACRWLYARPVGSAEQSTLTAYAGQYGLANTIRVLVNSNEFVFVP